MIITNYPVKEEIEKVFELIDNVLWRKAFIDSRGWKMKRRVVVNKVNHNDGYCIVRFRNRGILYHTIVWILINGNIPNDRIIDHIDGNKINNDISNLRLVTNSENMLNRYTHRSGRLPGCYFHKPSKRWKAQILYGKCKKHLGYFNTEEEAHEAYIKALSDKDK